MTGKKIRLVVSDLDGTLLRDDKKISDASRAAVYAAARKGIRFSVCTGRVQPMIAYYLKDLKLETPVITANGALIWDPVEKKTLWQLPMVEEEVLKLLKFCRENSLDYSALTMSTSYFSPGNIRKWRFDQYNQIAGENGFPEMVLDTFDDDFACIRGINVLKILIYEVKEGQLQLARDFIDSLEMTGYTSSDDNLLDVSHKDVSKGMGLVQLARILDIPADQVCAVGDYENDVSMLNASGFPVAMGNGCDSVRKAAEFVTRSNNEDGVAWMIEQCLL